MKARWVLAVTAGLLVAACSGAPSPTPTQPRVEIRTPTPAGTRVVFSGSPTPQPRQTPGPTETVPQERFYGVVTADLLNVRSEPSTDAAVLDQYRLGAVLTLTGRQRDASGRTWYRISAGGWVAGEFVQTYATSDEAVKAAAELLARATPQPSPTRPAPTATPAQPTPTSVPASPTPGGPTATATPPPSEYSIVAWVKTDRPAVGSEQTVFVQVLKSGRAVAGASLYIVVHYPTGDVRYNGTATAENGIASATFNIGSVPSGQTINVDVFVTVEGTTLVTTTRFTPS